MKKIPQENAMKIIIKTLALHLNVIINAHDTSANQETFIVTWTLCNNQMKEFYKKTLNNRQWYWGEYHKKSWKKFSLFQSFPVNKKWLGQGIWSDEWWQIDNINSIFLSFDTQTDPTIVCF